ncbi:NUDIX hydrolase [Paenibacillus tengchongensis]|uniref:NUDIX hydrolase n=1 Tax=Paenibacillus tengchongensis TaxID=2608684 RepID=UPI001FEBEF4D|nr:NUDIX domain-containing protein [Paenibacillus tengchongensis]
MSKHLMSVVHVMLVQEEQVLLLKRRNTGHHDGKYALPAGRLEPGEEVHMAAIREAEEECGVKIAREDLRMVCVMQIRTPDSERIDFFFTAGQWTGEPWNREPEKCGELGWYPLNGLPENTISYVRSALDRHRQGEWFFNCGYSEG